MADVLDLEETVRQLRVRIDQVRRQRARAEVERAAAEAAVESARTRLVEEFGLKPDKPINSQVARRLKDLQARLAQALEAVEAALDQARQ